MEFTSIRYLILCKIRVYKTYLVSTFKSLLQAFYESLLHYYCSIRKESESFRREAAETPWCWEEIIIDHLFCNIGTQLYRSIGCVWLPHRLLEERGTVIHSPWLVKIKLSQFRTFIYLKIYCKYPQELFIFKINIIQVNFYPVKTPSWKYYFNCSKDVQLYL